MLAGVTLWNVTSFFCTVLSHYVMTVVCCVAICNCLQRLAVRRYRQSTLRDRSTRIRALPCCCLHWETSVSVLLRFSTSSTRSRTTSLNDTLNYEKRSKFSACNQFSHNSSVKEKWSHYCPADTTGHKCTLAISFFVNCICSVWFISER